MPKKWALTTPSSPEDVACIFAADFSAVCKADGDMSNHYRWNQVLADLVKHAHYMKMSRFRNAGTVTPLM